MNVKENAIERDEHKIWGNRGKLCSRVKGGGYRDEGGALSVLDDGRAVMGLWGSGYLGSSFFSLSKIHGEGVTDKL